MRGDKRVVSYIKAQLKKGYERSEIVSHLVRSGHKREDAEYDFELAILPKTAAIRKAVEFLSIIALAAIIFFAGFSSDAPFFSVLAAFLPSIVSLIFLISVVETRRHARYSWIMPAIFSLVFLALGLVQAPPFDRMDIGKLTVLNLVISYIFLIIIEYPSAYKKIEHSEPKAEEKNIEHHFHAIEDKLKAINFVIGRVYRSSNNGTTSMRDDIRIPAELYNEFDKAVKEETKEQMLSIIDKIGHRLMNLQKTEKEVFGERLHLRNLVRDEHGNSRVIDVLSHNDNDPVMSYYNDALSAYREIRSKLSAINF